MEIRLHRRANLIATARNGHLWIGVSRALLGGSFLLGAFDELAVVESGTGADECDQVGCVDRAPALLG